MAIVAKSMCATGRGGGMRGRCPFAARFRSSRFPEACDKRRSLMFFTCMRLLHHKVVAFRSPGSPLRRRHPGRMSPEYPTRQRCVTNTVVGRILSYSVGVP